MNKSKSQIRHARMRALERFDVVLNDKDYEDLCRQIRKGLSKPVFKQSNRVSIHEVTFQGKIMVAVYDKERKTIASFLPDSSRF